MKPAGQQSCEKRKKLMTNAHKEVEYVAVNYGVVYYEFNSICSMCCHQWHILLPLSLSYPEKENRHA
jgi:hypothetical protein